MKKYFSFQWHITDECDQRCAHCYIFSENSNIPIQRMGWEDIKKTIGQCERMCIKFNRIPYFYITGGDPLLHKDFWKLLSLLKKKNIAFSLMGNPFHLNKVVCQKLHEYGCERYQMSIDGIELTHDLIRKRGSYTTTLEKISCIRSAGIKSVIMTTVSGMNIKEIPNIIDTVVEHRVDVFAFARYCPTSFEKSTHITPEEYREFLGKCWEQFTKYKDAGTLFNLKDHLWTLFLYEKGIFSIPQKLDKETIYDGCNCGVSHITILPNGDIYACRRMESLIGNIFSEELSELFLHGKIDRYRNFGQMEKCSKCELLRFCRGCPAVSYGYTGSHYSADPQCWKSIDIVICN